MTDTNDDRRQIVDWLKERGQTEAEIALIMDRLRQHDKLTHVDALMSSIAQGEIDIEAIINEVRNASQ